MCPKAPFVLAQLLGFYVGQLDLNHFPFPAYLCSLLFLRATQPFIPRTQICTCEERESLPRLLPPHKLVRLSDTFHLVGGADTAPMSLRTPSLTSAMS